MEQTVLDVKFLEAELLFKSIEFWIQELYANPAKPYFSVLEENLDQLIITYRILRNTINIDQSLIYIYDVLLYELIQLIEFILLRLYASNEDVIDKHFFFDTKPTFPKLKLCLYMKQILIYYDLT